MICLGSAYFAETKNFLLKVPSIKIKINWNNIMRPINNNKNKLNSKKNWQK